MFTSLLGFVFAQEDSINLSIEGNETFGQLSQITVASIVSGAIVLVLISASLIFFFMLVIGGIRWITSGGDKAQTEAARKQITAALVGLAIVFSAWAIIALVGTLFGISLLNLNLPSLIGGSGPAPNGPGCPGCLPG